MSASFSAILVGGPPHRGKSVLTHILSKLLHQRQVPFYLIRASPDGEGLWYLEAPRVLARTLRRKRSWDATFVRELDRVLAQHPLPYLVDAGGKLTPEQEVVFQHCTHAILLGADAEERAPWRAWCERYGLPIVAEIDSSLEGCAAILDEGTPLQLRLCGLDRDMLHTIPLDAPHQRLADRLAAILDTTIENIWAYHRTYAPAHTLPLNLDLWILEKMGSPIHWRPEDLQRLVSELSPTQPLAIYGGRPVWIPATLAAYLEPPLVCFDAHYGWVQIPTLQNRPGGRSAWRITRYQLGEAEGLSIRLRETLMPPRNLLAGSLPEFTAGTHVILDGQLPGWFYAAVARRYSQRGCDVSIAIPAQGVALQVYGPTVGQTIPWQRDTVF